MYPFTKKCQCKNPLFKNLILPLFFKNTFSGNALIDNNNLFTLFTLCLLGLQTMFTIFKQNPSKIRGLGRDKKRIFKKSLIQILFLTKLASVKYGCLKSVHLEE